MQDRMANNQEADHVDVSFDLDVRLTQDSHYVCDLALCQVRLENVRNFMWLILIPRLDGIRELHDLSPEQQGQLLAESNRCARMLLNHFNLDKINVGALGNMVPQFHWHVVGRRQDDAAWPRPVWGFVDVEPWTDSAAQALVRQFAQALTDAPEAVIADVMIARGE